MKIILKYIINNIKDRKMRTIVMLLSIALSTTLLMVSLCVGNSYAEAQRKMARGMSGSASLLISISDDGETGTSWISTNSIPHSTSIKSVVGMTQTMALYKEDGYYENFDVIAANLDSLSTINEPRLVNGEKLTDFTGNQIVLPDRFTSKFNLKEGDSITLWIGGESPLV